jgi:nitrite reductase (NO-forming)
VTNSQRHVGGVTQGLPTSRWRAARATDTRAADRVRRAHAQARTTVGLALAFVLASALAAAAGRGRWLPLHLFLAGGVVLAISGVSLMLTVTWSAAPAASDAVVMVQRVCVAVGAAGVAVGREFDLGAAALAPAGIVYVTGLLLLAALLWVTARRGVQRRFDPAVAAYIAAVAAGTIGVALGVSMAVGKPSAGLRAAHVTLNVLGLVGLVVGGTLPFFAATVGRSRMSPHATPPWLFGAVGWQVAAVTIATVGLATGVHGVAAAGLGAYAAGVCWALWLLPRLTRRQLEWAGPRLIGLWAGGIWWAAAVAVTAAQAGSDGVALNGRWLLVLVVGGYAQILWGSLAYLLPMLRGGGHEQLGRGFATTRSWIALAAANLAALAIALGLDVAAAAGVAVWVIDSAVRAAQVGLRRDRSQVHLGGTSADGD